ncbi:hypothetical protein V1283_007760 [Bradyrhizobium sp. AZCC 2262]
MTTVVNARPSAFCDGARNNKTDAGLKHVLVNAFVDPVSNEGQGDLPHAVPHQLTDGRVADVAKRDDCGSCQYQFEEIEQFSVFVRKRVVAFGSDRQRCVVAIRCRYQRTLVASELAWAIAVVQETHPVTYRFFLIRSFQLGPELACLVEAPTHVLFGFISAAANEDEPLGFLDRFRNLGFVIIAAFNAGMIDENFEIRRQRGERFHHRFGDSLVLVIV